MTDDFAAILRSLDVSASPASPPPRARSWQPSHTVYGGAHLFKADGAKRMGALARAALDAYVPDAIAFGALFDLDEALATIVLERLKNKLDREPVEDQRVDFEDGFGVRADDEEDAACDAAAQELARGSRENSLPRRVGIRIKSLSPASRARSLRTLERFFEAYFTRAPTLPPSFVVTLPKVTSTLEIKALARAVELLERRHAIASRAIGVELMVETAESLIDAEGRLALPALVAACDGRCVGVHLGAYDLTASLGVAASSQRLSHPLCDFARSVMQISLVSTHHANSVAIVDGATTLLPIAPHRARADASLDADQIADNRATMHRAWRLHFDDVSRALDVGIHQGWDLHPAQLVSRFAAIFAHYRRTLDASTRRLSTFLDRAAQASRVGAEFDDAASAQGLVNLFLHGHACGALDDRDLERAGVDTTSLATRSFTAIVEARARSHSMREK